MKLHMFRVNNVTYKKMDRKLTEIKSTIFVLQKMFCNRATRDSLLIYWKALNHVSGIKGHARCVVVETDDTIRHRSAQSRCCDSFDRYLAAFSARVKNELVYGMKRLRGEWKNF